MQQDNLYIRFDWAIKHILRDKASPPKQSAPSPACSPKR